MTDYIYGNKMELLLLINNLINFQHLSFLNYLFGISPVFFENRYIFNNANNIH